jgi:hypothetical protein
MTTEEEIIKTKLGDGSEACRTHGLRARRRLPSQRALR